MAAVEVIGTENICRIIRESKLSKFVVYRPGAGKGATPVYECIYTATSQKAADSFQSWAEICLSDNPFNTNPYELFLYQKEGAAEDVLSDDDATDKETDRTNAKRNKRRFTFMLASPYGNNSQRNYSQNSPIDVQAEIRRALDEYKRDQEIKELKETIKELEEGDDDDRNPLQDILELSRNLSGVKKKRGHAVAEDEDEDDDDDLEEEDEDENDLEDDDDEEVEEKKTTKAKPQPQKKFTTEQRLRINKAVHILRKKSPRIDKDLMKLATISVKKPGMFDTMIESLRNLQV